MNDTSKNGQVVWLDLTVPAAQQVRDFYASVLGWTAAPISMGDYDDYAMVVPGKEGAVAGICHAAGPNTGIPPVWMSYVQVSDLDAAVAAVRAGGGEVVVGPKSLGAYGTLAIIKDPAGASLGLLQPA